ncbi:uncharacterized protein LOC115092940 isoform X2 [Rhinatrema bivittatum]|uniref:uncharacterized protein LOC115092940 isoform X2 n=1 Tax=Rhinatrema bivittatum TaxID=194408 RepID=UPI0011272129|nr:uncharacterized protein LOC115092940 isoform X2 [Rhinatrema bivittatum]
MENVRSPETPRRDDEEEVFPSTSRHEAWREVVHLMEAMEKGEKATEKEREPTEAQEGETDGVKRRVECAWDVGHSFVQWAFHQAERRPFGTNLELDVQKFKVHWFFKGGMKWGQLTNFLQRLVDIHSYPKVLIIHLGGNDVGVFSCRQLLANMRKDLAGIMNAMPGPE